MALTNGSGTWLTVRAHGVAEIPVPVLGLFVMSVVLVAVPAVDFWLDSPVAELRKVINLDGETTLQAWFSSMQWFCAASLFGLFTLHAYRSRLRGTVAVAGFALACIVFSVDEIVGLHEWLGHKSDALLPGGTRRQTVLSHSGLWPFAIGVPAVAAVAAIVWRMRHLFLPASPRALRVLASGLVMMFSGALVIELGANFLEKTPEHDGLHLAQLVVEEFLEMLGVSFVIWAAYELLRAHGFALSMPASMAALPGGGPATESRCRLP